MLSLPYGIREIILTPYSAAGVLGTPVKLPAARTLSFTETEEFENLEGDDVIIAVHGNGPSVDFEIEAGGISLDAWKVLTGGTLTETGAPGNVQAQIKKKATDSRPYFRIQGRSISDSGGDVVVVIDRAKVTGDLEGEFANGGFMLTNCSGQGIADTTSQDLWSITTREQAAPISNGMAASITAAPSSGSVTVVEGTDDDFKVSVGSVDYNLVVPAGTYADTAAKAAILHTILNASAPLTAALGAASVTEVSTNIVVAFSKGINFTIAGPGVAELLALNTYTSTNGVPAV